MNLQRYWVPVAAVVALVAAYRAYGWPGVALAGGALVMWLLLHLTRMMRVLQRAARFPLGFSPSAVMLNARLRPRMNLLDVVGMNNALGEQISPPEAQPEVFRWTDSGGSHVTCEFAEGKLVKWSLYRPPTGPDETAQ